MKRVPFTKKARVKFPMEEPISLGKVVIKDGDVSFVEPNKKPKPQLKRTPFTKKHKVVHKVEDPNADKKLALVKKAARLRGEIFKGLHCVKCYKANWDVPTVPHHILNKNQYDHLRFVLMNLIPLCNHHHVPYAHGEQQSFLLDLLDSYPRHYRYYLNERDNRSPYSRQ